MHISSYAPLVYTATIEHSTYRRSSSSSSSITRERGHGQATGARHTGHCLLRCSAGMMHRRHENTCRHSVHIGAAVGTKHTGHGNETAAVAWLLTCS